QTLADVRKSIGDEMYQAGDRQGVDLREELTSYLQVQNFKKQYEEKLTLPRFIRYSQIVVSSNPTPKPGATTPPTAAEKTAADAAAKTKADALLKQLQGGADFATLAKSSSSAFSKDKGGDEGWTNPTGPGALDYLKGAATAKANQLLGPLKSFDGYHILKVTGETTQLPKDAKPETDGALIQAADEQYQKYLDDLVTKAKVIYVDPLVKGVIAQAKPDNAAALAAYGLALRKSSLTTEERGWVSYAAGQMLMSQNQAVAALADFDAALKSNPTSPDVLMAHGDAQNKLNKPAQAKEDYQKALKVATGNPMVLAQLGSKFSALKDPADAAAAMQAAQQASQRGGAGGMGGSMFPGMSPGGRGIQMSPQGASSSIQVMPQGGAPASVPAAGGTVHVGSAKPTSGHSSKSGGHGSH
ncbi:MAG: peptidyl-prolyl cis-trans isomerase, partial [Armatimonadota bacterium]|nr:peptidyl-prolyl cis-trans isomerase [Armatimonadota bacterium]